MDFIDEVKQFAGRIAKMKDSIQTEEATKTSMIMPFFRLLGYDVFNPLEFVPEYTADVGIKKGEKVDYAIMNENGEPLILIEAKWCGENLDKHASQLFRYFATTSAKFGILTNGLIYRFYTDLEQENKMDEKPFLEFNLLDIKDSIIPEIKKFQKSSFDLSTIMTSASELKYNSQIRQLLAKILNEPDDDFVRYFLSQIYDGVKTQKVIDEFRGIVKRSFMQFLNERINERLKTALDTEEAVQAQEANSEAPKEEAASSDESKIITTEEELEGFYIVKALLYDSLEGHTVSYKDTMYYFGILLDNNIRKWICRLYLGERKKVLLLPDGKKGVKITLESVNDLHKYKGKLCEIAQKYMQGKLVEDTKEQAGEEVN